jgi:hypothetical protein
MLEGLLRMSIRSFRRFRKNNRDREVIREMSKYRVTIDGVDVSQKLVDEGFTLSWGDMASKRASVKLYEQLYNLNDELIVYFDDTVIFQGDIDKEFVRPGEFICYASDQMITLADVIARNVDHREYSLRRNEDVGTGDNIDTTWELDYPALDRSLAITDDENDIEVFLDGVYVDPADYTLDGDGGTGGVGLITFDTAPGSSVEITCNYNAKEPVQYEVIFKDLLSYYYPGVFDVSNVDDTNKTCFYVDLTDKSIWECLKVLSQRANMAMWLEPPNKLYWKTRDSVSSDFSAIYGQNIKDLSITRDNFVKTRVIVLITLPGGRTGEVIVGTGSRTAIVNDDTINNETDATARGQAVLDELQDIQIRGEIELTESRHDLIPGTTCVLNAPQFGFENETLRIKHVNVTPKGTKLSLGLMTAMVEDQIVDFEERIRRLENRGMTWRVACDTSQQTMAGCVVVCEAECQIACETVAGCVTACQEGLCQTDCQTSLQITCVTGEQICGDEGTCQIACQTGHRCETTCQSQCQTECQTECQSECQQSCQGGCETSCQATCETACQTGCEIVCNTGCETSCQTTCQQSCQSVCETQCQTACEVSCDGSCQVACKIGCQEESLCCGTIGPD